MCEGVLAVCSSCKNWTHHADHRILRHLICDKPGLVHPRGISIYSLNSLGNVINEVLGAQLLAHTGTASDSTVLRKESGSALGVSTSTDTPSRICSST